jgi:hypothetical protein
MQIVIMSNLNIGKVQRGINGKELFQNGENYEFSLSGWGRFKAPPPPEKCEIFILKE